MPRILLVEDNELNRDMLSRRLERRGYEVLQALDGSEGVRTAQTEKPDLILLDISLPEMDGWEVLHHLKSQPTTQQIPVIALTAHAMADVRERALREGFSDYHSKPVEFQRLLEKVRTLLRQEVEP
jgi:two-component system, cell cycle response regulator DivK